MSQSGDPFEPPTDASVPLDDRTLSADLVAPASLLITTGPSAGRVVPLLARESVIGRSQNAHARVNDKAISARHALVVWSGDRHTVVDLGSTNGTFVNGHRITPQQPVELAVGDSIQVADTILVYLRGPTGDNAEHTRQLSRISPDLPSPSTALAQPNSALLAQVLQGSGVPAVHSPVEQQVEQKVEAALRIWALVRKHKVPLLVCMAVGALAGTALGFASPPPSEASCRIRLTPPTSADPLQRNTEQRQDTQFYTTSEQDFFSPALMTETLKKMSVPVTQSSVAGSLDGIKMESIAKGTYEVSYKHRDPRFAVNFLSTQINGFFASQIQKSLHVVQAEVEFLSARLKENDGELRRAESALKDFKEQHLDGLPEYAQGHLATREALLARRAEVSARLERSTLELRLARTRLAEGAPLQIKKVEQAAPFEQALVEAKRKLGEARAKGLGDQHPDVIALTNQIAQLQTLATQARTSAPTELDRSANVGLIELKNRVGDLEVASKADGAELGEVNAQISRLSGIVGDMPEVEAKYAELNRSYTSSKDMHAKLSERLRLTQLQLELENSSAKARYEILSPPESFGANLRKALLMRMAMGLGVGLVLGALIAVWREFQVLLKRIKQRRTALVPRQSGVPGRAIRRT